MRERRSDARASRAAGFTMTELAVVVGIIALMGAVALPSLLGFIRNYSIESTAKEMASEIQTARYKAISRNVNLGVLLVILDDQSYRYVIEDDLDLQTPPNWTTAPPVNDLIDDSNAAYADQRGPVKHLPADLRFDDTGATDPAFRYNRYGAWCQPGVDPECAGVTGFTGTDYVANDVAGATIRLVQDRTGLSRTIRVGTGGRVVIESN